MTVPAVGDLLVSTGSCFKPVGPCTHGQVLVTDSTVSGGVKWQDITKLCGSSSSSMCTTAWNANDIGDGVILSNNNLSAEEGNSSISSWSSVRASKGRSTGKRYFEVLVDATNGTQAAQMTGLSKITATLQHYSPGDDGTWLASHYGTFYGRQTSAADPQTPWVTGDTIGVAADFDNGYLYFALNNSWIQPNADPTSGSAGTGHAATLDAVKYYPTATMQSATVPSGAAKSTANFGSSAFTYTPPAGYTSWEDGDCEV